MTECSYSPELGVLIRNMRSEDYLQMKIRIEELESAIRQHRIDVWGGGKVKHCMDEALYKALGDENERV